MPPEIPLLAISPGDPHGIGPEVTVRAVLARPHSRYLVTGAASVMEEAARRFAPGLVIRRIGSAAEATEAGILHVLAPEVPGAVDIPFGDVDPAYAGRRFGREIHGWIVKAADLALAKEVQAVVTAPIAKTAFKAAGIAFPGHTELLAERAKTSDFAMMLSCSKLRVILATIHLPLRELFSALTPAELERVIRLGCRELPRWIRTERRLKLAVAGLNPHAGEDGMLGSEEVEWIGPLVSRLAAEGLPVEGPLSPDTVFHRAVTGEFDAVVALYHDQGLIPVKVLGFDEGVNSTIGLPFIRTSPDHGTAFGIAWQGRANPASMIAAIDMAVP